CRVMQANPEIGTVEACPLALMTASPGGTPQPDDQLPQAIADRRNHIVLMVGGMRANQAYKGHDQVIQAWPAVVAGVPGAHLVIAGDGDDRPRLTALARQSGA